MFEEIALPYSSVENPGTCNLWIMIGVVFLNIKKDR